MGLSWSYINFYSIVFFIAFLPATFPFNYLVERWGLRLSLLVAMFLTAVGAWL